VNTPGTGGGDLHLGSLGASDGLVRKSFIGNHLVE